MMKELIERKRRILGYWGFRVSCLGLGIPIERRGFGI
jgi:hypothetical protein